MKIAALRRNPRFRKIANRMIPLVAALTACFSTMGSLPDEGKHWRPLLVAQIVAAWLAAAVGLWTWQRGNRKPVPSPLAQSLEPQS